MVVPGLLLVVPELLLVNHHFQLVKHSNKLVKRAFLLMLSGVAVRTDVYVQVLAQNTAGKGAFSPAIPFHTGGSFWVGEKQTAITRFECDGCLFLRRNHGRHCEARSNLWLITRTANQL